MLDHVRFNSIVLLKSINCFNLVMLERFCTMYEKCKFLSMGYISALTQASVLIWSKNVRL